MNRHPLPQFTFHEARFLAIYLAGLLEGLADGGPPVALGADASGADKEIMLRHIDKGLETFLPMLEEIELDYPSMQLEKGALKKKILELNEDRRVQLYEAVKRFFWIDDPKISQAEALAVAGFLGPNKEGLGIARLWEIYELRRKTWK